jgi:hypothetical protein
MQVCALCVEHVPMLGQLPPGFVQTTFVPYLHVPTEAQGALLLHATPVAEQTPVCTGHSALEVQVSPVTLQVLGSEGQSALLAQMVMLSWLQ